MKCANEENRQQKIFLDKLERRMNLTFGKQKHESKSNPVYSRGILSNRYELQVPEAQDGAAEATLHVVMPRIYNIELPKNRPIVQNRSLNSAAQSRQDRKFDF